MEMRPDKILHTDVLIAIHSVFNGYYRDFAHLSPEEFKQFMDRLSEDMKTHICGFIDLQAQAYTAHFTATEEIELPFVLWP
ncbi:MAG: hypothetical protein LUG13_08365 [Oscillospiraceae bacterium]|nr:hypothetical protein [Oscillospiraceae bacterium]